MNAIERATAGAKQTAAPIEPGASGSCLNTNERDAVAALLPEFGRVGDVERIFALKRGLTYRAIKNGDIKSVVIRQKGAKTGARLIHLASVRDWLNRQMQ